MQLALIGGNCMYPGKNSKYIFRSYNLVVIHITFSFVQEYFAELCSSSSGLWLHAGHVRPARSCTC